MPLSHVRVLDFTQVRAGPTCTKILGDFGAEVIRVERPGEVDRAREAFDAVDLQRGKKSLVLDLGKPAGLEVVHRLAPLTDVVVENFRPGVKHRLGIDYERLSPLNPRLIYASISGFGQSGPYADRPGYDQIVQGMIFADPQIQQARLVEEVHHPVHGPMRVVGMPVFLHRTPAKVTAPSPLPGQHTREVLRLAGYEGFAIDRLLADGVAVETPLPRG